MKTIPPTWLWKACGWLAVLMVLGSGCRPARVPVATETPTPTETPVPTLPPTETPLPPTIEPQQPTAVKTSGPLYLPIVEYSYSPTPRPTSTADRSINRSSTPRPTQAPTNTPEPTGFPTPIRRPVTESDARLVVIGDYGVDRDSEASVANRIHEWDPEMIITVGDNNYPAGAADTIDQNIGKYFHDFINPYRGGFGTGADINRFFPTLGHTDWATGNGNPYFDYFTLPGNERYYDFSWGPAQFFALDSDVHEPDGIYIDQDQALWLQDALVSSTACWRFAYFHNPPYSSGLGGDSHWMQWPFQEWGIDAVFSGHDHHFERLLIDGQPYFVVGSGGNTLYDVRNSRESSQFIDDENYGFLAVTVDETSVVYEYYTANGDLVDQYIQEGGCE